MKKLPTILISVVFVLFAPKLSQASADVPFGFTSQEQHSETLLDYNARYYDADLARFPQADRVDVFEMSGNPQDLNAYAYVKNNPVNATDPTGNFPSGEDFYGTPRIPSWQMDDAYQSPQSIYEMNERAIYNSNLYYLDGMVLNGNIPFSMDYYEVDVAGDYYNSELGRSFSPGVGLALVAVKDGLDKLSGLDTAMGLAAGVGVVRLLPSLKSYYNIDSSSYIQYYGKIGDDFYKIEDGWRFIKDILVNNTPGPYIVIKNGEQAAVATIGPTQCCSTVSVPEFFYVEANITARLGFRKDPTVYQLAVEMVEDNSLGIRSILSDTPTILAVPKPHSSLIGILEGLNFAPAPKSMFLGIFPIGKVYIKNIR